MRLARRLPCPLPLPHHLLRVDLQNSGALCDAEASDVLTTHICNLNWGGLPRPLPLPDHLLRVDLHSAVSIIS